MAALRPSYLCHGASRSSYCFRAVQRRWAQVHDVRFLVTHHASERIADKYQEKLQQKAKAEGYQSVDDMRARYQEIMQSRRKEALRATPAPTSRQPPPQSPSDSPKSHSPYSPPPPPPSPQPIDPASTGSRQPDQPPATPPGVKTLSSFIDIEKTRELPQREIEYVWRLRHASDSQSLCAVIHEDTYCRIEDTARKHPRFILPLPREKQGAEIHFLQWTFPTPTTATVLFTHLAEFKLRGEYAQPHTTVTHHLDIRKEKGLVLLQGSVMDGRGVSVEEGKWLLMCLQKFYGGEGQQVSRQRLLEQFSGGDEAFKVEDLLEEAEKIV